MMSDIAIDGEAKPVKAPSLISLSFGGFNSIAIVTSSISILRLITAHSAITLHGIVADVVEWYKKFFHESFDVAVDWVNALHIHWLRLPYISDSIKDEAIIFFLSIMVMSRSFTVYTKFTTANSGTKSSLIWNLINFIIDTIQAPFVIIKRSFMMKRHLAYRLAFFKNYIRPYYVIALQIIAAAFAVGSMLILSAYS